MTTTSENSQGLAPAKRPGAPNGNVNRLRSGLRRSHRYLVAGRLPPHMSYIRRLTREFRTALEAAVIDAHSEISLEHAGVVNTAMRWEVAALCAQRWLATSADTLSPADKLAHVKLIAEASTNRDKCVKLLKLDSKKFSSPWAAHRITADDSRSPQSNGHTMAITEGQQQS